MIIKGRTTQRAVSMPYHATLPAVIQPYRNTSEFLSYYSAINAEESASSKNAICEK